MRRVAHKRRRRSTHRHVVAKANPKPAPKPITLRLNPLAGVLAGSHVTLSATPDDRRGRYLWLAGLSFALLAAAGLSLYLLSSRALRAVLR